MYSQLRECSRLPTPRRVPRPPPARAEFDPKGSIPEGFDSHGSRAPPCPLWEFLEILLEICKLCRTPVSRNFRGNLHAPAETVSRIFQDTHVQSHFGGRCGVPPPQARKILPQTGPLSSKSTILYVSLGLPGSGAGADIEIFGLDPHQFFLGTSHGRCGKFVSVCVWKFPDFFPEIC